MGKKIIITLTHCSIAVPEEATPPAGCLTSSHEETDVKKKKKNESCRLAVSNFRWEKIKSDSNQRQCSFHASQGVHPGTQCLSSASSARWLAGVASLKKDYPGKTLWPHPPQPKMSKISSVLFNQEWQFSTRWF